MGRKRKNKQNNNVIGIIVLIIALLVYLKLTVFKDFNPATDIDWNNIKLENPFKKNIEVSERSTQEDLTSVKQEEANNIKEENVYVDIFFTKINSNGKDVYMAVSKKRPKTSKGSNVEFAIRMLLYGPSKYEKSNGLYTEIPSSTKLLSFKETPSKVIINLSDDFEFGGGGDSLYKRMYQLIKTANHNTRKPVYLFINGKQATMIGGEGLMLKQPLRNDSLEE